jgi:hypothetical protein
MKENKLFRDYIINNNYKFNLEKIEEMIKRSEDEIVKLKNDESNDAALRESLFLKRKSIE